MPELPIGDETGALTVGDLFQTYTFMAHPWRGDWGRVPGGGWPSLAAPGGILP